MCTGIWIMARPRKCLLSSFSWAPGARLGAGEWFRLDQELAGDRGVGTE